MRFLFSALLALFFLPACGSEGPPRPKPTAGMVLPADYDYPTTDSVRVATWNLEHFVDGHDNPYIDAGRENQPSSAMNGRVDRATRALRHLDADLVVLQEAESEAFLSELVQERLDGMGYRFATSVESPTWYMNVVLLSRFPLGKVRDYADVVTPVLGQQAENGEPATQSLTNHRLWLADVRVAPDQLWTIAGAHLKAGRGPENRGWRIGQIRFLHAEFARLLADRPQAPLLVAGDLNSLTDSPEMHLLLNRPDRPAPDSLREDTDRWRARFIDPLSGTPTPTHPSGNPSRQLDYLLPNSTLADRLVGGSMHVARPLSSDSMAITSDHLPVVATFQIGP